MRIFLHGVAACWLVFLSSSPADTGITARFVPARVRPGDVFELRVEMDRPDYARFDLRVPEHARLHRVAVESVPVALEAGRYRQQERWLLQADASGEVVIDGASVVLETTGGELAVALPPLRVEVLPYGQDDASDEPLVLPADDPSEHSASTAFWWLVVPVVLAVIGLIVWVRKSRRPAVRSGPVAGDAVALALSELDSGVLTSAALEHLVDTRGVGWSRDLREAAGEAVYAGRGDPMLLADMLRKEVAG